MNLADREKLIEALADRLYRARGSKGDWEAVAAEALRQMEWARRTVDEDPGASADYAPLTLAPDTWRPE